MLVVPEEQIDALSHDLRSGPAYVFFLIEQLTKTAIDLGFTAEQAAIMVERHLPRRGRAAAAHPGRTPPSCGAA